MTEFQRGAQAMRENVLRIVSNYRDQSPEEDESWESWYFAAFDLAMTAIHDLTTDEPIEDKGRRK